MEVKFKKNTAILKLSDGFDLANTFECGQCFRWNREPDGAYCGIVRDREVRLIRQDDCIVIENCTEEDFDAIWKSYFDLDTDYGAIRRMLSEKSPSLRRAVDGIDGIRILRQDPWEALCSFILSQNNNIPRIRGIITRLCEGFGEPCGNGYRFPAADTLAGLTAEELAPLRAGFRAKYILDAARKVASGEVKLTALYTAPIEDCRQQLMTIYGVGSKVAECVLLYGLHRTEAFPVDVWMKKALSGEFSDISVPELGAYAGIAQQYIFHYMRINEKA